MNKTTPGINRVEIAPIVLSGTCLFDGGFVSYDCLNEYQKEYQNDSERYVRIGTDTHCSLTNMSKKSRKIGLNCPIPTLASFGKFWVW